MRISKVSVKGDYELWVIEKSDLTPSDKSLVFYRADTRDPDTIFKEGFQLRPDENVSSLSKEMQEELHQLLLRRDKNNDIDIARGISATLKASRAAYFPQMTKDNRYNTEPRFIYAIYAPTFFNVGNYAAANNSLASAGFDEVVVDTIRPDHVIAAIRCEVMERSNHTMTYRLVASSLRWNPDANQTSLPGYDQRKLSATQELQKLLVFDSLQLHWQKGITPAHVTGIRPIGRFREQINYAFNEYAKSWKGPPLESLSKLTRRFEDATESIIFTTLKNDYLPVLDKQSKQEPEHISSVIKKFRCNLIAILVEYAKAAQLKDEITNAGTVTGCKFSP